MNNNDTFDPKSDTCEPQASSRIDQSDDMPASTNTYQLIDRDERLTRSLSQYRNNLTGALIKQGISAIAIQPSRVA